MLSKAFAHTNTGNVFVSPPADLRQVLPAILVGIVAGGAGFLFGYDSGVISGLLQMEPFNREFGSYYNYNIPSNRIASDNPPKPGWALSTGNTSLVVSLLSLGTFIGALSGSVLGDWKGRRPALMIALVVFSIGVAIQCLSKALAPFCIGRVVAGLGVGLISSLVPLYQSETAPRWVRGGIVAVYQFFITIGLFVASLVDNGTKGRGDNSAWLIPISMQFIFAFVLFVGLIFLPESPRFRVKQGRQEDAAKILAFLNGRAVEDPLVQAELKEVVDTLELELKESSGGWGEILKTGRGKQLQRITTGCVLQALTQMTGINFIFYYGTTFFLSTGAKNPFTFSVIANLVNVLTTPLSFIIFDKIGRRPSLLVGAVEMSICQFFVAAIGTASKVSNRAAQRTCVGFVMLYIVGFATTWGPGGWIYCSESYSLAYRSKGNSLSAASNWAFNFAIGYMTPYLVDSGPGKAGLGPKIFFVWAVSCLFCTLFSWFCIYETKGLSLEEVDTLFRNSNARTSSAYNAHLKSTRGTDEDVDASEAQGGLVAHEDHSPTQTGAQQSLKD